MHFYWQYTWKDLNPIFNYQRQNMKLENIIDISSIRRRLTLKYFEYWMMNYKNMIFKGKQTSNLQRIIHEYEKGFETCYFLDKGRVSTHVEYN